jgi:hypothetical protein
MKVRWITGSVRFRITPSELEALQRGDIARVELRVPGGKWAAEIAPSTGITSITFDGGALVLSLSTIDVQFLCRDDTEGVYFQTDLEPSLRYFIEKDFPCIHPRSEGEPESETFAAPAGLAGRHIRGNC